MTGKFEPKTPVNLAPPKDDPISLDELAKANGKLDTNLSSLMLCSGPISMKVGTELWVLYRTPDFRLLSQSFAWTLKD